MTTLTEDWTLVDAMADEPGIGGTLGRQEYCRAAKAVARRTGGIVTAAQIRAELRFKLNPNLIGALASSFANHGVFVDTGRLAPSGDKVNRNARRRLPVWSVPDLEAVK